MAEKMFCPCCGTPKALWAFDAGGDAVAEVIAAARMWLEPYEGWSRAELEKRVDPATLRRIDRAKRALAKLGDRHG